MSSTTSAPAARTCSSCGATSTGKFCGECGAALEGAICGGCRAQLSSGAKFCHRCGTAVGTSPVGTPTPDAAPRGAASVLPWGVAAIALLALIALVAGQRFAAARGGALDAPRNALPQAGLDDRGAMGAPTAGAGPAPDISSLTPRQRADRLFDRVMRLSSEGKTDSVQFFAPMALGVYDELTRSDTLDLDLRYDFGRVAEVAGAAPIATAQADTILRQDSTHLLGLILAERAARLRGDDAAAKRFEQRLVAAEAAETKRNLPEYQRHQGDILDALARARAAR
jgi:hypothetical protein